MATMLKPSSIEVDQADTYFKNELNKTRFAPPSIFNQLKKMFIYLALFFSQTKPDNKKDIAAKQELLSSLKTLLTIEQDKLITFLSEVDKIKLITKNYIGQRKSQRNNFQIKSKRTNISSKATASAAMYEEIEWMKDIIRGEMAKDPIEHERTMQDSYKLLNNMEPWVNGKESKDDFKYRLTATTADIRDAAKANFGDEPNNDALDKIDDAYKYLRDYATPSSIKLIPTSGMTDDDEETKNNTSSIASLKHR